VDHGLGRRSRAPPSPKPLTSQDLAHHWPIANGNGLANRSRTRIRPGHPGTPAPGLTWGFEWKVLGSNQRRLSRRFYSEPIPTHRIATDLPFPYFPPREYRALSVWRP